jgi:hypothetical protein
MGGSLRLREHFGTDQAEAQVLIEHAKCLADVIRAGEQYRSRFAKDCASVAKVLAERQIANPRQRENEAWFVADVEGAVYIFARRSA